MPAKAYIHRPPYRVCRNERFRAGLQLSLELSVMERYARGEEVLAGVAALDPPYMSRSDVLLRWMPGCSEIQEYPSQHITAQTGPLEYKCMAQRFSELYLGYGDVVKGAMGYSDRELSVFEQALNISSTGDFRLFMEELGKATGEELGRRLNILWCEVTLYYNNMKTFEKYCSYHNHIKKIVGEVLGLNHSDMHGWFVFLASEELDGCLFLKTKSEKPNQVWRFSDQSDEDHDDLYCDVRHESFGEFVREILDYDPVWTISDDYSADFKIP